MSNNPKGSAIILTILAVSALLTVGLGVVQLVPKDFRTSLALEASLNAEHAAWSGVEQALLLLRDNPFYELQKEYIVAPNQAPPDPPKATVCGL